MISWMKWDGSFKEMDLLLQGDGKLLDSFKKISWIKWRLYLGEIFLVTLSGNFKIVLKIWKRLWENGKSLPC